MPNYEKTDKNRAVLKQELLRKSIHISGSIVVAGLIIDKDLTFFSLWIVTALYIISEALRLAHVYVPVVHVVTESANRETNDQVVVGPITLTLGIMLAIALFPLPIAIVAILALTLGDGFSSLIGRTWGTIRPSWLYGKSIEGSLACFTAVFVATLATLNFFYLPSSFKVAMLIALVATTTEALPIKGLDNLTIPLATGLTLMLLYHLSF